MTDPEVLTRRALLLEQTTGHPIYMFTLTGDEILEVADISRLARDQDGALIGYQRPEVKQHVDNIVDYLDGPDVLFPNAIILALSSTVRFKHSRGPANSDGFAAAGTLEIPLARPGEEKPGWIVDGQQRTVALSRAKRRDLPVPVIAFVADTVDVQRDQFVRVNSAKPLPRGLVTELLPEMTVPINPRLAAKRIPSALVDELNQQEESPFFGLIRRASSTATDRKRTVVTDTSLINALEESLRSPGGHLYPYRNDVSGETDIDGIWAALLCYWGAVRDTFPDAWGKKPTQSRLMHGVGIRAMGRLMDKVMASVNPAEADASDRVRRDLAAIAPHCHWTDGTWSDLGLRWNELQNVPKHIRLLSNFLIRLEVQHQRDAG